MARPTPLIDLPTELRAVLEGLARSRETAHSLVQRAQIVLRAADGESSKAIAHYCERELLEKGFARCEYALTASPHSLDEADLRRED